MLTAGISTAIDISIPSWPPSIGPAPSSKPQQVGTGVSVEIEEGEPLLGISPSFKRGQVVIEVAQGIPLVTGQPSVGTLAPELPPTLPTQPRWLIRGEMAWGEMAIGALAIAPYKEPPVQVAPPPTRLTEEIDSSAKPLLTSSIRQLLSVLRAVILTKAISARIPVRGLRLTTFQDPEEGWKELMIEVRVDASAQQALAFWDSVGDALDSLKAHLPSGLVHKLYEEVAIHVEWH